jgi:V/A-type H+-transporting ATPase subunit C
VPEDRPRPAPGPKTAEETSYGFAIGRLRALETALLDRARYERLVRQPDADGMRAVLTDTRYGALVEETGGLEPALRRASEENFAFLEQYCEDGWVLDLFRLSADVHNLKTLIKSRLLEREPGDDELLGYGAWPRTRVEALAGGEPKSEPERFRKAAQRATERSLETKDPAEVDIALDREAQAARVEACRNNGFLSRLFELRANTENLRTLARVRAMAEERGVLEAAMMPGGSLKPAELLGLVGEDDAAVVQRFRLTGFGRMMDEGLSWLREKHSLARLERLGRELELEHLLTARYLVFGFEPLVAFYLVRENEIGNLRRLAAAKTARLPEEGCRELVSIGG